VLLLLARRPHGRRVDPDRRGFGRRFGMRPDEAFGIPFVRSHPDFEQITAYIRKDTHRAIKIALLQNGKQEFSELVEELLCQWLKLRG
jgi:hypothetical protein